MRQRRNLYPEVTTIRLREGTLDALHAAAEQKRITAQEMVRREIERLIAEAAPEREREQAA